LPQAALLAAGIKGIEDKLELAPPTAGDIYENATAKHIPSTLRASTETLRNSTMLREAMGDAVVDHYVRCAEWEQEEFDKAVTDWEIARGRRRRTGPDGRWKSASHWSRPVSRVSTR
jgi:glutamine synthetase